GDQGEPDVARLADGRVIVTWTDFGMNGGDASGAAIRSQILDPRTGPVTLSDSGGNDEWVGTAFADTMNGGAGADILNGAAGDDILIGGAAPAASPNQLRGGTGSDTASYAGTVGTVLADLGGLAGYVDGVLVDQMSSIENLSGGSGTNTL